MNIFKKLLVGTTLLLVIGLFFAATPKSAAAASPASYNDMAKCINSLKWNDYAHITCQLGSNRIVFTDSDPTTQHSPNNSPVYYFSPPPNTFSCLEPETYTDYGSDLPEGLIVHAQDPSSGSFGNHGQWSLAWLNEGFTEAPQPNQPPTGCQSFERKYNDNTGGLYGGYGKTNPLISNGQERSHIILKGTKDGAQSLDDVTDGPFANHSFSRWQAKYDPTVSKGGNKVYLFAEDLVLNVPGQQCSGNILAVGVDNNDSSAFAYEYTLDSGGDPFSKYPPLNKLPNSPGCKVSNTNFGSGDLTNPTARIYISPAIQNVSKIGASDVTQVVNPTAKTTASCAQNFDNFLAFIICPALSAADSIIGGIYGQVENQLCFNTGPTSSTGGVVCQGSPNALVDNVKGAWIIFKNIASALLVIVMLVMVFSQAFGGGPFDAYAIRKTLPKLVIAVILMQLSFVLLKYVIDLSNDAGSAIGSLIMAPFGGSSNMDLGRMIGNGVHVATGGGAGTDSFQVFAVLAAAAGAVWVIPALPLLALYVITGVFIAFFVLILRKLLIIMLVMLAPIALICWILPGTDNYWKLWKTNLTKLLMMFPLIMAMLAAGRVLAYITSQAGGAAILPRLAVIHLGPLPVPYFASATGFADLAIIIGAFFAPYFLLPKTFNWGGDLLKQAGGAVNRLGTSASKKAEEPLKGYVQRKRDKSGKAYLPKDAPGSNLFNRTTRSLRGGRFLPTKYQAALLAQRGDKYNDERDAEAQVLLKRKGETAMREGYEAAVLTKDKSSFAKYARDDSGNLLDKKGNIAYRKSGVDANGKDIYTDLAGNVTSDFKKAHREAVDTYDEADKRTLTGVAAMKQMWVDLADQSKNKHERKMAVRQLTATASWPEIQGSLSRGGNKVIDTEAWADSITTSQEDYPKVLRSRVDATPHIDNYAKQQLAEAKSKDPGRVWSRKEEKNFISQQRVLYSIRDQMSNEDFQTQSEGYWEEVARVANLKDPETGQLTKEAVEIKAALQARLKAIRDIGGTAPQQLIGHLVGGSVEDRLDEALAGTGITIRQYAGSRELRPPQGSTPTLTRENIKSMSESQAIDWIDSRRVQGVNLPGVKNISDEDLRALYNSQRGEPQRIVREELQARGLLNPLGSNLPGSTITPDEGSIDVPHDNE